MLLVAGVSGWGLGWPFRLVGPGGWFWFVKWQEQTEHAVGKFYHTYGVLRGPQGQTKYQLSIVRNAEL